MAAAKKAATILWILCPSICQRAYREDFSPMRRVNIERLGQLAEWGDIWRHFSPSWADKNNYFFKV